MLLLFTLHVVFAVALTVASECDKSGILIYEDLGCTPEYGSDKTCPKKFSCNLDSPDNKCLFRGKVYEDRESVDGDLSNPSCDTGCFCNIDRRFNSGKNPAFICAILDCPEWLGLRLKPNCYRKYSLDQCCSSGQVCPPFDNIEKCVVEGKEYREGERFSPPNSCLRCVCQKGFKGKFEEPFCKRAVCGAQLKSSAADVRQHCAPMYNDGGALCCPNHWICPDGSEEIKGETTSEDTCKFGDKTVKVGQHLEKKDVTDRYGRSFKKVVCECVIPPLLKCSGV